MPTPHPLMAKLERTMTLTDAERRSFNDVPFYVEDLKAGEGPSWAGDRPSHSFVVLKGFLSTSKTSRSGKVQITAFHIRGDMPDLQALHLELLDSDIAALTNCTLAFIAHQFLRPFCERNPRLGAALWRATLVEGAISREWVINVGQREAISRLAHLLCEMMTRMEAVGLARNRRCDLPLTQEDLSGATGLSVADVNRTLQELKACQLLSFEMGVLSILNWDMLTRAAEFELGYLHLPTAMAA